MLRISTIAALALGLVAAGAPAAAETGASVAVPYADLNLTSEAGRAALDRRLARAATQVCGGKPDLRRMQERAAFRACLASTRANYEAQRLAVLEAANAGRVALLADKLDFIAVR
jgi:UrcA family protein